MRRFSLPFFLLLFFSIPLVSLVACGTNDFYACEVPCVEVEEDPCPSGECVRLPSLGWDGPVLLWTGAPEVVPLCPERASSIVYQGYDGLQVSPNCPACSCGSSACRLSGLVANSADGQCPATGTLTPYPAPEGWDGSCVSHGLVPAAELGSVEFAALTESPCEPLPGPVPESGSFSWATVAVACRSTDPITACDGNSICVPTSDPPPPGYLQCLYKDGVQEECPLGYPARRILYGDADVSDVGCSECACSPPEGGVCEATVRVHSDASCSVEVVGFLVDSSGPQCIDPMPPGFDLQAMSATWIANQPGDCKPSGGELVGEAKPTNPATFCCQVKPQE